MLIVSIYFLITFFAFADDSKFYDQLNAANTYVSQIYKTFNFAYERHLFDTTKVRFNLSKRSSADKNPIREIQYGLVNHTNDGLMYNVKKEGYESCGVDNHGMFVIEVRFKSTAEMPSISPLLAGKVILFVATDNTGIPIYLPVSDNELSDYSLIPKSISSFSCHIKSKIATSAIGSPIALKGISFAPLPSNQSSLPGLKSLTNIDPRFMFKLAVDATRYGLFAGCGNRFAPSNDMAGLSRSYRITYFSE